MGGGQRGHHVGGARVEGSSCGRGQGRGVIMWEGPG